MRSNSFPSIIAHKVKSNPIIDKELLSLLKVDGKGLNLKMFIKQNQTQFMLWCSWIRHPFCEIYENNHIDPIVDSIRMVQKQIINLKWKMNKI